MEKWNLMYEKTYNFVYLRAKTILKKEEDIQQLMKEVYLKAVAEEVAEDKLYEWLGKQVYTLGCGKFRKKKVREAELIELDEQKISVQDSVDREVTKEVICEVLEELPDMYYATLYACYYDYMTIKDISTVMGYSVGTIVNRLNYVHKYLEESLLNYQEENGVNVQFSVQAIHDALHDWSANHQLSEQMAYNIYASVCRQMDMVAENGAIEYGIAGGDCRVSGVGGDGVGIVCEELALYSVKKKINQKQVTIFTVLAILILFAVIGVLALGKSEKNHDKKGKKPIIEQDEDVESGAEESSDAEGEISDENIVSEDTGILDSEYILPKSDTEKLTRADLEGLTKEQLRLARNEIYARHGMIFGVEDLDNYFATKSWYKPTVSYTDFYETVEMSIVEEENVILIQQVEKER